MSKPVQQFLADCYIGDEVVYTHPCGSKHRGWVIDKDPMFGVRAIQLLTTHPWFGAVILGSAKSVVTVLSHSTARSK